MDYDKAMMISCNVLTENPEHALKASEKLARVATGLMLDGIENVSFTMVRGIDAEDEN